MHKIYIGVKVIDAKPMTRLEYNQFRGWSLPDNENGEDPGYLVHYLDGGQANTDQYPGYVSWSPKDVFDRAYRPADGLTFGLALEALKKGERVTRAGWNGKGQWLSLSGKLGGVELEEDKFWSPHNRDYARQNGGKAKVQPCITLKTAQGEIQMGWLASQSDMLAEDWIIL